MRKIAVATTILSAGTLSFVLVAACSSSNNLGTAIDAGVGTDAGGDTGISYIQPGETPQNHFATTPTCRSTRPPVTPDPIDAGDAGSVACIAATPCCTSDSDCVDAGVPFLWTNGRCTDTRYGFACTWDQCVTSSDCTGTICSCASDDPNDYNKCVSGNCQNDGDCGPGGFCSPSVVLYCGGQDLFGIYCHTPDDKCLNDSDCASVKSSAGQSASCAFDQELKRWQCVLPYCAG